jgi:hypothetical protein
MVTGAGRDDEIGEVARAFERTVAYRRDATAAAHAAVEEMKTQPQSVAGSADSLVIPGRGLSRYPSEFRLPEPGSEAERPAERGNRAA